jgi:hypothetical protein
MTSGATLAAIVFHAAPVGAEGIDLSIAAGFAIAAAGASLARLRG